MSVAALAADLLARSAGRGRYLVAIAGPPGAGKSTLAEALLAALEAAAPGRAALVPMDGYHLDNAVLAERGLLARKGAPETFDVDGLARDLARIRAGGRAVAVPVFDRRLDLARAAARIILPGQELVLVEGNYLLLGRGALGRAGGGLRPDGAARGRGGGAAPAAGAALAGARPRSGRGPGKGGKQ